jgi:SAM-dependent methyltransferase
MLDAIASSLVCPRCHGPLAQPGDGAMLECQACSVRFSVEGGIPRMSDGAEQRDARMAAEWKAQSHACHQYSDPASILANWEVQVLPQFVDWLGPVDGMVLDVGCGVGHLGRSLAAIGRTDVQLIGTDFQAELLAKVEGGYSALVEADVHHLPFKDGAFAAAVASNSLHHFPDLEQAMREIARVLKPGGVLVSYDPRYITALERLKKRLRRNDQAFTEDHKAFRIDEYHEVLASSGLQVTDVHCIDPFGILLATGLDYFRVGRSGRAAPIAKGLARFDRLVSGRDWHTPLGLMLAGRAVKLGA